jgi:hypothetical protein
MNEYNYWTIIIRLTWRRTHRKVGRALGLDCVEGRRQIENSDDLLSNWRCFDTVEDFEPRRLRWMTQYVVWLVFSEVKWVQQMRSQLQWNQSWQYFRDSIQTWDTSAIWRHWTVWTRLFTQLCHQVRAFLHLTGKWQVGYEHHVDWGWFRRHSWLQTTGITIDHVTQDVNTIAHFEEDVR